MRRVRNSWLIWLLLLWAGAGEAQESRRLRLCVLDFGPQTIGRKAAQSLAQTLQTGQDKPFFGIADRDESRVAARGHGYTGSLNLSLEEARDLGGALGCEFYILGQAVTKKLSTIARPVYYESYAALLLVNGDTGRLLKSDVVSVDAQSVAAAEKLLASALADADRAKQYTAIFYEDWQRQRDHETRRLTLDTPQIEDVPEDNALAAQGLRLPAPYRRLQPPYPQSAARAEAVGTVDVLVSLDIRGEVTDVEVVRWAGFGLDEATVETVRKMHFRPAMRDGVAIPLRVLLRYNFRVKPKE